MLRFFSTTALVLGLSQAAFAAATPSPHAMGGHMTAGHMTAKHHTANKNGSMMSHHGSMMHANAMKGASHSHAP